MRLSPGQLTGYVLGTSWVRRGPEVGCDIRTPLLLRLVRDSSAAGDRGDHRDLPAVLDRRGEPVQEAHVLVADIHVDEATQLALLVDDPALDPRIAPVER